MLKRILLIGNPAARRGLRGFARARAALQQLGIECHAVLTERGGHAADLARRFAPGHDAVFAAGGDGTVMEIAGALAPDGPPIGIIPVGTGNLLARALGIPLRPAAAARALAAGGEARIDLGRLGDGRRFAIGTGVGIDAAMIASTSAPWKRRLGVAAYVVTGTRHAAIRRRFEAVVTVDGERIARSASSVLVANFGVLLSGLLTLGDGIRADDGLLDVCIFDPRTTADAVRIASRFVTRRFASDPAVTYARGREIRVETDPVLPAQADGELIGETPFTAVVEPLAARVLTPQRER